MKPDPLTKTIYRLIPLLMLLGLVSFVLALVARWQPGFVIGAVLFGVAGLGSQRVIRYGSVLDFELLRRSDGWTSESFTIGYRDTEYGRARLEHVIEQGKAHGYEVAGEPRPHRSYRGTILDVTLVKQRGDKRI